MQHPPPWHVPYLVKTLHPSLETVCGDFGYPLPTHDAIVHIVRNPIDAIGAATGDYVSPAIAMFEKWHSYWKTYESTTFPNIPAVWIRYEDVCYCQAQVLQKLLEIGHVYGVPQERIDRVLDSFTCDLIGDSEDQLGYFLDKYVIALSTLSLIQQCCGILTRIILCSDFLWRIWTFWLPHLQSMRASLGTATYF